jgi:anti-anti-sigma factor
LGLFGGQGRTDSEEEIQTVIRSEHPSNFEALTVRIEDSPDGSSVVAIAGELDLSTIPKMQRPLFEQIAQRPAVLVDLSGLSFIDSSGIGVLIEACRCANGAPMHVLIGSGSQVERVFSITGVSAAMPVFSDRELALAELASHRGKSTPPAGD